MARGGFQLLCCRHSLHQLVTQGRWLFCRRADSTLACWNSSVANILTKTNQQPLFFYSPFFGGGSVLLHRLRHTFYSCIISVRSSLHPPVGLLWVKVQSLLLPLRQRAAHLSPKTEIKNKRNSHFHECVMKERCSLISALRAPPLQSGTANRVLVSKNSQTAAAVSPSLSV